jgi:ABC-type nickel/cobalt efflux system permease component RcnA
MIDTQLLNGALLAIVISVGVAIALSIAIVAAGALTQRHERRRHIREIEQHLAAAAKHRSAAAR